MNLAHARPGDWLTFGAALTFTVWLASVSWPGGQASKVIIRSGGKVFREAALSPDQRIPVPGPLGTTLVDIQDRRVRIAADPGPHQYCVRQGWLSQAGEIAICLPNQISVELAGNHKRYDSLNY
jgi:hypothetical protein